MSGATSLRMPMTTLDDDAWDDLLSFIEERRVIPIVNAPAARRIAEAIPTLVGGVKPRSRRVIRPVLVMQREFAARNHGDQWQHVELAAALYGQALADSAHRGALLHEAAALLESVPLEMRQLHSVRVWRDRILGEQRASTQAAVRGAAARKSG